jgi:hypothetical protein
MMHVSFGWQGLQFSMAGADAVSPLDKRITPTTSGQEHRSVATAGAISTPPTPPTPTPVSTVVSPPAPPVVIPPAPPTAIPPVSSTHQNVKLAPPSGPSIGDVMKRIKSIQTHAGVKDKHKGHAGKK